VDKIASVSNVATTSVAAGDDHSLYITADGKLYAMGYNLPGKLSNGDSENRLSISRPVLIAQRVASVAARGGHSLYITTDGKLYAMGKNYAGQLGDGSYADKARPVLIAEKVASVAAGGHHSLYITTDGKLYAMGYNDSGQLGDGHRGKETFKATPVLIAEKVASVAAGRFHSLYITTDGKLYAMGWNSDGQLGDGTSGDKADKAKPVLIAEKVASVAAGGHHSLYITTDGKLYAMGWNNFGQLGNGNKDGKAAPVLITERVSSVAAGENHSLYITTDGKLYAMGKNNFGQLGDGSKADKAAPVLITEKVASVAAGGRHSLYITTDGKLHAMGANNHGQLGDRSYDGKTRPVLIAE
jgi:alpha-tubulin suppressor-like RCC1 family protein